MTDDRIEMIALGVLCLTSVFCPLSSALAAPLPIFEDFRSADRERRETGRLQTAESMALARVDPKLIARVATENRNDPKLLLGVAELRGADWPVALEAGGTNAVVALRFACASAIKRDYPAALRWFRYCQTNDPGNLVPWLGELWVLRQQGESPDTFRPPERAMEYRDYGVPAARARVRVLEKAGYTPYAARRIALMQNTFVESMAQDLSRDSVTQTASSFPLTAAHAMQRRPTFLLTEFVGQSLERAAVAAIPETDEEEKRIEKLDARREELKQLVSATERHVGDFATESAMVQYYDNVLLLGEETAMKWLAESVRRKPLTP
jgi:hypothetical protein